MPRRRWLSPGHFASYLDAGGLVEVDDEMPDPYRRVVFRFVVRHAHSELMAAATDREWVARAPGLRIKMAALARAQDELDHARVLYGVAADLGGARPASLVDDLLAGRGHFHQAFRRQSADWAERVLVDHLVDGAGLVAQRSVAGRCSYGPYRRALLAIVPEEEAHVATGLSRLRRAAVGTQDQRRRLQAALDRRWGSMLRFFGPDRDQDEDLDRWRIKAEPNAVLLQRWLEQTLPTLDELGLVVPDPIPADPEADAPTLVAEGSGRRQRTAWVRRAMDRQGDQWVDGLEERAVAAAAEGAGS